MAEVKRAIDGFIAQALERLAADPARRQRPLNLLEAMLVAADTGDSGLGNDDVACNVLIMLLTGEDITANRIARMLYLMTRHPHTLDRARRSATRAWLRSTGWRPARTRPCGSSRWPRSSAFS